MHPDPLRYSSVKYRYGYSPSSRLASGFSLFITLHFDKTKGGAERVYTPG